MRLNNRSYFAGGVLTPPLTKGDAHPLWKPHLAVPRSGQLGQLKIFVAVAALLLSVSSVAAQPARDRPRPPSITVNGEATIAAEPDQAQIDIGVTTQARTAPEASRENAERLGRVVAEVKKLLSKTDEVKTSGYALNPQYRYPQGGKPEIVGYLANNIVRIKTAKLDDVGKLIDAAMQAGANNINRLMFTLKDEEAARLDALRQASAKAKAKAEAIAASLGLKILRIASVTEGERTFQPIYRQTPMARGEALTAQAPTPVEPGTVDVKSTVSLTAEVSER
ncbi:MAG TPA: SIMPL domain-containing protein [Candidatus Limnocylindrales bacterium]|nr:SIMPL domain-containing protein [Candidatus Limnocylindrales bacterium]